MSDLDVLIAEAEGLCAAGAAAEGEASTVPDVIAAEIAFADAMHRIVPELLAALRQRPGREEVERVLREFWGRVQMPVPYDINELSLPTRRRMEADVASALRDLGYGAGDGR